VAISANSVFEIRTTGSDSNGGGFVTGASGTDFSQQDSAQYSAADLTVDSVTNTKVTSAAHSFVASDVGNLMQITAGAGFTTGFYQIVSVTSGAATLDRSPAAVSTAGGTYAVGGALSTPGRAVAGMVANNIAYLKSGSYSITTATAGPGGPLTSAAAGGKIVGYGTTRSETNTDTPPTITLAAASVTAVALTGPGLASNIAFDGASQTSAKATSGGNFWRCSFIRFTSASTNGIFIGCSATNNSAGIFSGNAFYCEAYSNSSSPFVGSAFYCIASNNTGAGYTPAANGTVMGCVAYANTGAGVSANAGSAYQILNTHCEANGGAGFLLANSNFKILLNCSAYNNTGGAISSTITQTQSGFISVTAGSVFNNAASGDFSLNNTANQGALLRAAGYPALFPRGLTANYADIGAAQHQDSGGTVTNLFVLMD
jgi:hypothetical protein